MTEKRGNDIREVEITEKGGNDKEEQQQQQKEIPEGLTNITHRVIFVL